MSIVGVKDDPQPQNIQFSISSYLMLESEDVTHFCLKNDLE